MKQLFAIVCLCIGICFVVLPRAAQAQIGKYCAYAHRTVAILIDRTTQYDDEDRKFLQDSVPAIDRQMVFGTRVIIRSIGSGFAESRTVFDDCVPGCPETSLVQQFTGISCIAVVANAARTHFRADVFSKLRELSETAEQAEHSDIARTIVETARSLKSSKQPLAELVIFSDMIDNVIVPYKAIYAQRPKKTLSEVLDKDIKADLSGANVSVFGFGRSDIPPRGTLPPRQYENLRRFWLDWFKASRASNATLGVRLE